MRTCSTSPTLEWMQKNVRLGWIVLAVFVAVPVTIWSLDYEAPFEILEVEPATARPGEWVSLHMKVRRDTSRGCYAIYSRVLITAAGIRLDLVDKDANLVAGKTLETLSTPQQIAEYEALFPGELHIAIQVPAIASPGLTTLGTSLKYTCNPLQEFFPIHVYTKMTFNVLPPT